MSISINTPANDILMPVARYGRIAVILHWLIALGIFVMLASGLVMEYAEIERSLKFNLYQWHKSLGVIILLLVIIRVIWRLLHKPPELSVKFGKLEKLAAHMGHLALYMCMIAMPLSGWAIVSSSSFGLPTIVFGLFEWPHIPGISANNTIEGAAKLVHWATAWTLIFFIILHVAAVVKHALIDKENLLTRMWFGKTS